MHGPLPPTVGGVDDRSDAAASPSSERHPRLALSKTLWGIDWAEHLPHPITSDVLVKQSSYDEALPFVREHYATIFREDGHSPFSTTRVSPLKERYYRIAGDFFAFATPEATVGLLIGTPVDWSTYYIRSAAMLPEYAGRGMVQELLCAMFDILRGAGVERVEASASPANMVTMRVLARVGFNVTGTVLSERWGAQVHYTRFLDGGCEGVFLRQFCTGVRYELRDTVGRVAE